MDTDGANQTLLTRGSSPTWSPGSNKIAFHASALYYEEGITLRPIRGDPGAPTIDSDIFVANVHALAAVDDVQIKTKLAKNITNTDEEIEEDADWSASTPTAPDGLILFTSYLSADPVLPNNHHPTKEIYVINPDGSGRLQLTFNDYEERAPSWSPDGTKIAFMARIGDGVVSPTFEICVMNADGSGFQRLTRDSVLDASPGWSPDGTKIIWQHGAALQPEIWTMNPDGTAQTRVTSLDGFGGTEWGVVRTRVESGPGDGADETFLAGSAGSSLFADGLFA